MTQSLTGIIGALRLRGVTIKREGLELLIEAPPGILTAEDRATLRDRKAGMLVYLERDAAARKRIGQAMLNCERAYPDRFDWCRSNSEVTAAGVAVDQAITDYVEGPGSMTKIEKAWKSYIRTIDTKTEKEKQK